MYNGPILGVTCDEFSVHWTIMMVTHDEFNALRHWTLAKYLK